MALKLHTMPTVDPAYIEFERQRQSVLERLDRIEARDYRQSREVESYRKCAVTKDCTCEEGDELR
jgi:hypothetical protein